MYFKTIAIIPGETNRNEYFVKMAVNDLLLQYWKYLDIGVDNIECQCVGSLSLKKADEHLEEFFKVKELREEMKVIGDDQQWLGENGEVFILIAKKRLEYLSSYCPYRHEPDPECPICNGTGYVTVCCNHRYKWSSYVIGGRFTGKMWGTETSDCGFCSIETLPSAVYHEHWKESARYFHGSDERTATEYNPELPCYDIAINCRVVSDIPLDDIGCIPYALVTPDGAWHEECDYISPDSGYGPDVDDKWRELLKEEYAKYPHHLAVMLECHRQANHPLNIPFYKTLSVLRGIRRI